METGTMGRMDKAEAAAVLRRDQELNRRFPAKPGGPLRMSISPGGERDRHRGRVMSEAGKGYWDDMRKMYPHLDMQPDTSRTLAGRTRFGKPTLRMRGGIWYRRVDGQWKPLHDCGTGEATQRRGDAEEKRSYGSRGLRGKTEG